MPGKSRPPPPAPVVAAAAAAAALACLGLTERPEHSPLHQRAMDLDIKIPQYINAVQGFASLESLILARYGSEAE